MNSFPNNSRIKNVILQNSQNHQKNKDIERFPRRFERGGDDDRYADGNRTDQRHEFKKSRQHTEQKRVINTEQIENHRAENAD